MSGEIVVGYGRFRSLSRVELERFCHLDDEERKLIAARRRDYNRLGLHPGGRGAESGDVPGRSAGSVCSVRSAGCRMDTAR
ncbi:hypothetical protein [Nocardia sp. NPDC049526]|uniref:hypothetical protein n=1 Tax=Nocardia sp. NPDC049526 TaxID=3364316 RepID=UPI00379ACBC7